MSNIEGVREIMTVNQVAELLEFSGRHIRKMAEKGEIPAKRISSEWRFSRRLLMEYIENGSIGATTRTTKKASVEGAA